MGAIVSLQVKMNVESFVCACGMIYTNVCVVFRETTLIYTSRHSYLISISLLDNSLVARCKVIFCGLSIASSYTVPPFYI